jgi:hypothetical protein
MKYLFILLIAVSCNTTKPIAAPGDTNQYYEFVSATKEKRGVYTMFLKDKKYLITVWHYHTYIVRKPIWSKYYKYDGCTLKPAK